MKTLIALALVCSLGFAAQVPKAADNKVQGAVCDLCTEMIKDLEEFMVGGHTEQEAIDYLKSVRNYS